MADSVSVTSNEGHSHMTQTNAYVIKLMKKATCKRSKSIDPLLIDQIVDCSFDPEAYSSVSHYIFRKLGKVEQLRTRRILKFQEIIHQLLLRGHEQFFEDLKRNEHLIQALLVFKAKGVESSRWGL